MKSRQFVLSADPSIMSNYRDNLLFGNFAGLQAGKFDPYLYEKIFCPTVKFDKLTGEALFAPLGIRRIESSLRNKFKKKEVIVSHPFQISKSIGEDTKVVGLEVMDPFGTSPVMIAMEHGIVRKERTSFKKLCLRTKELKKKNGFKIVVGGPGAWQFSFDEELRHEYGIDHVVIGEADDKIPEIIDDIVKEDAPELIFTHTNEIRNIPYILRPTCVGLIEAMRGCGRGCNFCDPNLRKKRDFSIERLKKEASVNLKIGLKNIWLQSDEILLYGLDNSEMRPNKDAVVNLFKEMKSLSGVKTVGAIHLSLPSAVAEPDCINKIAEINNLGPNHWTGVQVGLETASSKLIKKHMPLKVKPFSAGEWPQIALEGIKLLCKNHIFPVNTIIIGLPGEDDDDVRETIDLIRKLEGFPCMVVPFLYTDYKNPNNSISNKDLSPLQWELDFSCWKLNAEAISKWTWEGSSRLKPYARIAALVFAQYGIRKWRNFLKETAKNQCGIILR